MWCVVHIDHVLVGEVHLHGAQRIVVAGFLAEVETVCGCVGPIH